MQHHHSLDTLSLPNSWLTIGVFDGVHCGHQQIIRDLVAGAHAAALPAVVLTFDPHPAAILRPQANLQSLTSPDERAALLGELGVDHVITHPFNRAVAALSAEDFLRQLKAHLGFTHFRVGYDFKMGRDRAGDIPRLRELGEQMGYALSVADPLTRGDAPVSSSRIRAALADGRVEEAAAQLGRRYAVSGAVVPGAQRGRSIGIPTANVAVPAGRAVPAYGIYACLVQVDGQTYGAATNIGVRPTFETSPVPPTVEAHLLDFDQDIYGREVRLEFAARLRGEQKFDGVAALVAQIHADIARTREVLYAAIP
jgi:riboflavin kinase/FMN adenylyltransferase